MIPKLSPGSAENRGAQFSPITYQVCRAFKTDAVQTKHL